MHRQIGCGLANCLICSQTPVKRRLEKQEVEQPKDIQNRRWRRQLLGAEFYYSIPFRELTSNPLLRPLSYVYFEYLLFGARGGDIS